MPKNEQPSPCIPAEYENADISAIQALMAGTATPEQQKRALNWIVYRACTTDDVEYRTESRDHAFASGRRFVGLQIRKLMGINLGIFRKNQEPERLAAESRASVLRSGEKS